MLEQEEKEETCQIQRLTQGVESKAGRPVPDTQVLSVPGANDVGKTTLFDPIDKILSEEHLDEVFGVEVRLYPSTLRNRIYTRVLSLGLKGGMERGA